MAGPFLIVGLGNPGPRYTETRHNAGFWFLDRLAGRFPATFRDQTRLRAATARVAIGGQECILAHPTTFMNESGLPVRAVMEYYRISETRLLVAYDELDLPSGVARLKQGGGHGGHNGLRDIFRHVPNHEFLRLRIGIGHPGSRDLVTPYVLSRPTAEEAAKIRGALDRAVDVLPDVLADDVARAMNTLHTADPEPQSPGTGE